MEKLVWENKAYSQRETRISALWPVTPLAYETNSPIISKLSKISIFYNQMNPD